jgi:hypothetical protein
MPYLLLLLLSATPLLRHDFEDGTAGWVSVGKNGSLRVMHEGARNGSGALTFDYVVGDGFAAAALPLKGISIARMDRLQFWIKTDVPTAVAIMMNEKKPGGNYTAICWSTGNTWQRVELTPRDFHLSTGEKDPIDPDGKLDLDAVENIGIIDLSTIFGVRTEKTGPIVVESHAGKHSLSIDDFEVLADSGAATADVAVIDTFETPQLRWLTLGGVDLKPDGGGMRAVYRQTDDQSIVLLRQVTGVDLRGKESLAFEIASGQPAELLFNFEVPAPGKAQGPRYSLTLEVPGGGKIAHREVQLAAFEHAEDSPEDPNGRLVLNQMKNFSILDITGVMTHAEAKNSLWIGNIRGVGDAAHP